MPHLLLIAMSGVRVVDPELRALGLTLPGFVKRGKVIASMPSLGLLTIAGATPHHWTIAYREVDELDLACLDNWEADLVAVSSLSARVDDAYRLLDALRGRGVPTVLGGLHTSVMPDEAAEHADAVVVGQGEWVWPRLIADFERGELQRRYDGMQVRNALESTPLPRFDLLDRERYNRIPVQTTRGCPLDCAFCAASRLISPYKRKSLDRVRQELDAVCELWPSPFVELADDNTFVNKTWARELAALMEEYPQVKWFTETDLSVADDERLLEKLARSGCAQVLVGLESVSEGALDETDRGRWKRRQRAGYREKIRRIQDAGISVNGCFVFGFDDDTPETFERTWEFIQESGLSEVQATLLTPFPGTELYRRMRAEGRLLADRFWDRCTLFDVVYRPRHFSPEGLAEAFRGFVARVYSPAESEARAVGRKAIYRLRRHHVVVH